MANWEADADLLHSSGARHALILSQTNSAVGQIAEGMARALAPRQVHVSSAGVKRGRVDPLAKRVLAELSVNIADEHPKALDEVDTSDVQAILVVSEEDPTPPGLRGVLRVHWPLPDPAAGGGTEEEKLARYRAVRNELRRRLIRVFARELVATTATGGTTTSIGPASGGDLDAIGRLLVASLLPSRDVGGANLRFIVASEGGRLIGCAGLQVSGQDGLVRSMAVHWTRRNAGLGSRLHERLLFEAVLTGVRTLYVVTTTAEDFFAGHGFKKIQARAVPPELQASEEFTAFVPGGSTVMSRPVSPA
jgi:N-acetylglutamate synthase-like GNAT family acetyltransferase/protein-tyrosine-phosphatase